MKNSKKVNTVNGPIILVTAATAKRKRVAKKKHSKDYSKFQINGETLGKGRTVFAVVQSYIKKHPDVTVAKLKEVFGSTISTPKRDIASRIRFFSDTIQVGSQKIVVSNQWKTSNFSRFMEFAKKQLRVNIKPVTVAKAQTA